MTLNQVVEMLVKEIDRAKAEMVEAGIPEPVAARFICDHLNRAHFMAATSPMKQ